MDLNYAAAAPEIFFGLAICVVLLVDVFLRDDQRETTYVLAMLALIGTAAVTAYFAVDEQVVTFNGSYRHRSRERRAEDVRVRRRSASRSSIRASTCRTTAS